MAKRADPYVNARREDALDELRAEVSGFTRDALLRLSGDLEQHVVLRGSWSGCVISYKRGGAGSCRRDRFGRARNAFTVLWDRGGISEDDVMAVVQAELLSRVEPQPVSRYHLPLSGR